MNIGEAKRIMRKANQKINLMFGRGKLSQVNDSEQTQKLQFTGLKGEVLTDIERLENYGIASKPLSGSEVLAIFPGGNRESGIVLSCHDRRYRPTDLEEGEVVLFTQLGKQQVRLTKDGSVKMSGQDGNNTMELKQTGEISMDSGTGAITLTGSGGLSVTGAVASIVDAVIAGVLYSTHVHEDVHGTLTGPPRDP